MQVLLSRIERDYILHSFKNETPELNILSNGKFYRILNSEYKIQDDNVFFKQEDATEFLAQKSIKVFFTHKEIPFCFNAEIKEKNKIFFFEIPEQIFKTKNENEDKSFLFLLETSSGFKLKAKTIKKFPLAYSEENQKQTELNEEKLELKKLIEKSRKGKKEEVSKAVIERIHKIENHNESLQINTGIVFIDSESILIYCSEKQAHIIAGSISTRVEISLKERNITASVAYDFFYSPTNKNIEFFTDSAKQMRSSLAGIVCLSIKKIQEEDKRFLHEHAHSEKYGSLS